MGSILAEGQISLFVNATEDRERILSQIKKMLQIHEVSMSEKALRGYYNNPILLVEARVRDEMADLLLRRIFSALSRLEREQLIRDLDDYLDERGALHIRLDKQALVVDEITLGLKDAIKVKFRLRAKARKAQIGDLLRPLLKESS